MGRFFPLAFLFVYALFLPFDARADDLAVLDDVSNGGVTIHEGDTVRRSDLSSASTSWTFHFTWPSFVPNARARLVVFRGTFGAVEGNTLEEGVNYSTTNQQWPAEEVSLTKSFSLPALGDRLTASGTYTAVVADASDMQGFLDWFASGGLEGVEPANYSSLTFHYLAEDTPEEISGAIDSISVRDVMLHGGDALYRNDLPELDTSVNDLDRFWNFVFNWPETVPNSQALFMVFHGSFGAVDGGVPVLDSNYGATFQSWSTGENNISKYLSLPALKDANSYVGTYTFVIAERDPKNSANDASGEALWFSSGGTDGIPPKRYSFFTLDFKGDRPTCCDSVLFLPGITGSRLYRPGVVIEHQLWEPLTNSDIQELALNADGSSVHTDIYTKVGGVVGNVYNIPVLKVYDSFFNQMNTLKSAGTIQDFEAVPYDWRLSLDDIVGKGAESNGHISYTTATDTPYIAQELKRLANTSQTGKVTIVAHSMGGLVTKELLRRLGNEDAQKYVDRVILVASPQVGTPESIPAMLHGFGQSLGFWKYIILSESGARVFSTNALGAYSLLPSSAYFSSVQTPVVTFPTSSVSFNPEITTFGNTIETGEELSGFLRNSEGRLVPVEEDTESAGVLNSALLNTTEAIHQGIDAWVPPANIDVIQIAGWGQDTLSGIEYYFGKRKQCFSGVGVTQVINGQDVCVGPEVRPVFTSDGDGTVVVPSSLYLSTSTPNVSRYWVDLESYATSTKKNWNHGNIFEVAPVLNFIQNTLNAKEIDRSQFILTSRPVGFAGEKSVLRFRLHSPLTVDLYDASGDHTGISPDTLPDSDTHQIDEEIPNSYYFELGDTKYLGVGSDENTSVVMSGYADGTFDFDIDEVSGDTVVASTSFSGVPTSPTTIVRMSINGSLNNASKLEVDSDGDGTTDFSLAPALGQVVIYTPPEPVEESASGNSTQAVSPLGGGPLVESAPVVSPVSVGEVLGTSTVQVLPTATISEVVGAPHLKVHQVTTVPVVHGSSTKTAFITEVPAHKGWFINLLVSLENTLAVFKKLLPLQILNQF